MSNRTKRTGVSCIINDKFFDNILEPKRKELERKIGVKVTQEKFTQFLFKSNAKIVIPKSPKNMLAKQLFGVPKGIRSKRR